MEDKVNKMDKRLLEREISRNIEKETQLKSYFASLPDETANAQWVEVELHDTEIGDSNGSGNHSDETA